MVVKMEAVLGQESRKLWRDRLDRHHAQLHRIGTVVDDRFDLYGRVYGDLRTACGAHQKKLVFARNEESFTGLLLNPASSADLHLGDGDVGFRKHISE